MAGPSEPHDDPKRTAQFTPMEPAETGDQRTTDHVTPPIESTVDRGTNNPDFVLGQVSAQEQHNIETGTYDPDRTGTYAPPQRVAAYRKVDGYEILGKLGQGGMGVVYKAREEKLNRIVALKMILSGPEASPQILQRFQTEAEAVAKLQHPNIVQIFAIGESEGNPYFSLEFVPGTTLAEKVGKEPQDAKYSAAMVETLARAMQFAHNAKIIHRDLKPANVLLNRDGAPKVADFGLAKELEEDRGQTNTGAIMGTPSYMSPEQASGTDHVGPATDIYALGAILYDLLTGRPPFAGTTKWNTLEMVRKMEPIPPGTLTSNVPKDLDTICLKCLQKEPAKRYATALELAEDLRRFLDGRAILARPISSLEKAWRWAKRNPVMAGLSTLFVVTVIGFSIVSWILKVRADDSAALANEKTRLTTLAQIEEAKQRTEAEKNEALAKAAQIEESKQRVEAEKNGAAASKRSLEMVGTYRLLILQVQDALRTHPNGRVLRENITRFAMSNLDNLKKEALQSPIVSRTEAGTMQRMADIYLSQNRPQDADQLYAKAEAIIRNLREQEPEQPVHCRNLAAILNLRGDVAWRSGRSREAEKLYQTALDLRKEWSKMPSNLIPGTHPSAAGRAIAESLALVGHSAARQGDPEQAAQRYSESLAAYHQLPNDVTSNQFVQREVNIIQYAMAIERFWQGRTADAQNQIQAVAKEHAQRLKENPGTIGIRRDMALSLRGIADLEIYSNRNPYLAWDMYIRALPIFAEPLKDDPLFFASRTEVALIHFKLGIVAERLVGLSTLTGLGLATGLREYHFAEALRLRQGMAQDGQTDIWSQTDLALSLASCRRGAEAEKIVDQLLKIAPTDPPVLSSSLICIGLAAENSNRAESERLRNKAISILETLLKNGWKNRVRLETDPTLAFLRTDPRFGQILQRNYGK